MSFAVRGIKMRRARWQQSNTCWHESVKKSMWRDYKLGSITLSLTVMRYCRAHRDNIYIYLQAAVGDAADAADSLFILITLLPSAPRRLKDRPNGNEFSQRAQRWFALGVLEQSAEWRNSCIVSFATRLYQNKVTPLENYSNLYNLISHLWKIYSSITINFIEQCNFFHYCKYEWKNEFNLVNNNFLLLRTINFLIVCKSIEENCSSFQGSPNHEQVIVFPASCDGERRRWFSELRPRAAPWRWRWRHTTRQLRHASSLAIQTLCSPIGLANRWQKYT